jgi:hypothetical protein
MGAIEDFVFACANDDSPGYFTYEGNVMVIIQSGYDAKSGTPGFLGTEPFMDLVISHESIHVVIRDLEGERSSESMDDLEVVIDHLGRKVQLTINILAYAHDNSGIVHPY